MVQVDVQDVVVGAGIQFACHHRADSLLGLLLIPIDGDLVLDGLINIIK